MPLKKLVLCVTAPRSTGKKPTGGLKNVFHLRGAMDVQCLAADTKSFTPVFKYNRHKPLPPGDPGATTFARRPASVVTCSCQTGVAGSKEGAPADVEELQTTCRRRMELEDDRWFSWNKLPVFIIWVSVPVLRCPWVFVSLSVCPCLSLSVSLVLCSLNNLPAAHALSLRMERSVNGGD